jgi:hypothetical protein
LSWGADVFGDLTELTFYWDPASFVAHSTFAEGSTTVMPQWLELAEKSLAFLVEWVVKLNACLVIESAPIDKLFGEMYGPRFEQMDVCTVLPMFRSTLAARPPGRFGILTSEGTDGSVVSTQVLALPHPSWTWSTAAAESAVLAEVRTRLARPTAHWRRARSSLTTGPVSFCCGRPACSSNASLKARGVRTTMCSA